MSEGPLLRPEEVAGVLTGMGTDATAPSLAETAAGPIPYSLRDPVAIPPGAEGAAKKRIESFAGAIQEALRRELGDDVAIEVDGFQQQAAAAALSAMPAPARVPCFTGCGGGIALVLAPGTALALVERALGGAGAPSDTSREPTALELRVMAKLGAAASGPLGKALRCPMAAGEVGVGRVPASVAAAGETVGVGLLRLRLGQAERSALMLVPAKLLAPPPAEAEAAASVKVGPLASAIERVRVEARPVLRAGRVSFGDLVELKQGTVLRLDVSQSSSIDLRIVGQTLFRGRVIRDKGGSVFRVEWRRGRRTAPVGRNRQ